MSDSESVASTHFGSTPGAQETVPPRVRRYTTAYKLQIIRAADGCTAPGELASMLRREGIYYSTLKDFRKQHARGDLDTTRGARGSSKPSPADTQALRDLAASERENRKLRRELERAKALLDLQKKVSDLMGLSLAQEE